MDEGTLQSLRDILQVGHYAAELVGRWWPNTTRPDAQLAAEAIVARLGGAAPRLDSTSVAAHPDVPSRRAEGIRNLIAHHHIVDPALGWASGNRLPCLCAQIEQIIEAEKTHRPAVSLE